MITIDKLTENLKTYIATQIDTMSKNTPMISFMKPLITRALDKNFNKITKALDLIAEMSEGLLNTNPFLFKTQVIGDIEIGGGQIKFNLPFTSKRLVLNMDDINTFKEMLTNKE